MKNINQPNERDLFQRHSAVCREWAKQDPKNYKRRYTRAKIYYKHTPEEIESKATDLLEIARLIRSFRK